MGDEYQAGCGAGDFGCMFNESMIRMVVGFLRWTIDVLVWALNIGSISATEDDGSATGDWTNAISMSEVWFGLVGFIGVVIVGGIAITKGIMSRKREDVLRAVLGTALAMPVCVAAIWFVGMVLNGVEAIPQWILDVTFDDATLEEAVVRFIYPSVSADQLATMTPAEQGEELVKQLEAQTLGPVVALLFAVVLLLACLVIIGINVIRNITLQVAIAVAPVAFMLLPTGIGREVITNWFKITAMVILMKPIMVTYVGLMITGFTSAGASIFSDGGSMYLIGLLLVVVVPFMVMSMFNFLGADTDGGGREVAQRVGQNLPRPRNPFRGGGRGNTSQTGRAPTDTPAPTQRRPSTPQPASTGASKPQTSPSSGGSGTSHSASAPHPAPPQSAQSRTGNSSRAASSGGPPPPPADAPTPPPGKGQSRPSSTSSSAQGPTPGPAPKPTSTPPAPGPRGPRHADN